MKRRKDFEVDFATPVEGDDYTMTRIIRSARVRAVDACDAERRARRALGIEGAPEWTLYRLTHVPSSTESWGL